VMRTTAIMLGVAAAAACAARSERDSERDEARPTLERAGNFSPEAPAPSEVEQGARVKDDGKDRAKESRADHGSSGRLAVATAAAPAKAGAKTPEGPTRAWFPETFLFAPLVVTDDHGAAVVPVRVPDRLTTWRVLALAHARTGAQAGAVTRFLGTLPIYVDPVVPPFLVQRDEVRLPIQIINTTDHDVTATLEVAANGASILGLGRAGGTRSVAAQSSALDHATLVADRAGSVRLRVGLGGTDAVERSFEVRPAGRPVTETRSGTLAAPRSFSTAGTPGADPSTDRVRLRVFPGALALLRSELSASTARAGVDDDAYALLLAGKAAGLLAALHDRADPDALRELAIVAGQRAIRDGRTLDVDRAALLTEPALAHANNPVLARLGERAAAYLAQNQRPDGTFAGATGWTLQRVLVVTAEATRAAAAASATAAQRQRAMQVAARAAGAFGRTSAQVSDGFTAAAILASGAATGELAEMLRTRVRSAILRTDDGAAYLDVPVGVVRGDGAVPSRVEATALAVLALGGDKQVPLADLGTTLLGAYSLARGWGDGRTNLVAMQAVLALFKDPLPRSVKITLQMDDAAVVEGTLEGDKLRDVLALDGPAPGLAHPHRWKLIAEPAVPGLGYSLALDSWPPWHKETTQGGLELALPPEVRAAVGVPVDLAITAIAPSGIALHIQQALPAGVQVDAPSLEAQVKAGTIERFVASDGALDVYVPPLAPGKTFALAYRAIATLGGTLHTGASLIEAGPRRFHVPPVVWIIK
jgi:hypothetical protein